MTQLWNYNFYGRGCSDFRDHRDPHRLPRPVSDSRHDNDTTKPNAPRLIYLARWNTGGAKVQVTGQVTGHRPQASSQVRPQVTGQVTG